MLKNLSVYGSVCDRVGWNDVIAWVEQGRLNLRDLITHTFPLEEAPHAYDYVRYGSYELGRQSSQSSHALSMHPTRRDFKAGLLSGVSRSGLPAPAGPAP